MTGTRSADASVRLFDHRKLSALNSQGTPIEQFEGHTAAVLCVQVRPEGFLYPCCLVAFCPIALLLVLKKM